MGIITSFLGLEAAGVSLEDALVLFGVLFAFSWGISKAKTLLATGKA